MRESGKGFEASNDDDGWGELEGFVNNFMKPYGAFLREIDKLPQIVNREEVEKVLLGYSIARMAVKDLEGVQVTYRLHQPRSWSGSVEIRGRDLAFGPMEGLLKLMDLFGNIDLQVYTDKTVSVSFLPTT